MKSRFLFVITVLLLTMLVAACGAEAPAPSESSEEQQSEEAAPEATEEAEGESEETAPEATEEPSEEAAPEATEEAASSAEDSPEVDLASELRVFNWADYIEVSVLEQYEEEYGVEIIYDSFTSNEDLLAKLQAGATGYDVIFPSDYMVAQMIELDMLAEINKDNIPNLDNIGSQFLDAPYDPGNKYCVPYQWGTTGLAYHVETFGDETPESWATLFDPEQAEKWAEAGGINVLNDQRELIGAALKYLGYSVNDTDEDHLNEARDLLLAIKPFIKTFNSDDYDDTLLIPGEVVLSHAYSGEAAIAYWETYDEETETSEWGYIVPKEGGVIWQDNMCITQTSDRQATAEHFINYLLEPEVGAAITNYTYYPSPNEAAKEFILPEILEDESIYLSEEKMANLEWLESVDEAIFIYDRVWTEFKSQ